MKTTKLRKMSIGARLAGIVFLWLTILIVCGVLTRITGSSTMWKYGSYLAYLGSPVVATIVVVIALRQYPASRPFLKGLVAVTFVATVLTGGFYHCATIASHESLLKTIEITAGYSQQPPTSTFDTVFNFLIGMIFSPWKLLGGLSFVMGYLLYFAAMSWPYFVLLMLITPRFLAMPIFWLLVVLGFLYVVPQPAWVWIKAAAVRVSSRIKENRDW